MKDDHLMTVKNYLSDNVNVSCFTPFFPVLIKSDASHNTEEQKCDANYTANSNRHVFSSPENSNRIA